MAAKTRPPQQNRSRDTYERLLRAGYTLLAERDIDAITVQDITREAPCSVGSFYFRFKDKYSFFVALIENMIAQREEAIEATFNSYRGGELAAALARGALANYRRHAGLLRSVVKKHLEGKKSWRPISRLGTTAADRFVRSFEEAGMPLSPDQAKRVHFAFVWLYGHLTMGLLDLHPGPGMTEEIYEQETIRGFERAIREALSSPHPA